MKKKISIPITELFNGRVLHQNLHVYKRGVNRGKEIRRSVLFQFWSKSVDPPLFSSKSGSALRKNVL